MEEIFKNLLYPAPISVIGLIILMCLDLITGVQKAKINGENTTSSGLRKTLEKGSTYLSCIISLIVILNLTNSASTEKKLLWLMDYSVTGIVLFTCYIEFKSILENLIIINTKEGVENDYVKFILKPLHNILIANFKK